MALVIFFFNVRDDEALNKVHEKGNQGTGKYVCSVLISI